MTPPPFALPAMLACALALAAGFELCLPLASPEVPPPVQVRLAPPPAATVSAGTNAWSAVILQRPLFRPDRRKLALADEAQAAAPPPLPRLSAIVITAAGATAIFAGDDGTSVPVRVGGLIDGDRVAAIGPAEVAIIDSGARKILKPQFAPGGPADATAAAPPDATAAAANATAAVPPSLSPLVLLRNRLDNY